MEKITSYLDWQQSFQKSQQKGIKEKIQDLLQTFILRSALNKTASLPDACFKLEVMDCDEGILHCRIEDGEDEGENSEICINTNNLILKHDCAEFRSLNLYHKKFCSHLIRLFLILKQHDPEVACFFLKHLKEHDYDFFPQGNNKP